MLIRAFLWGNDLKAFLFLKSAIFAFPHECHKKPTTATTTWNSKQKLKSAIFCFFSHSFSEKQQFFGESVGKGLQQNRGVLLAFCYYFAIFSCFSNAERVALLFFPRKARFFPKLWVFRGSCGKSIVLPYFPQYFCIVEETRQRWNGLVLLKTSSYII